MKVSAVGFLFQDSVKGKGLFKGKNYTCIIHKANQNGGFNKNVISSPLIKRTTIESVSPEIALNDVEKSVSSITNKKAPSKFIGATVKDGVKETEIHSIFMDKIFAVRTKDDFGKNRFRIMGKKSTQKLLSRNLYLNV